MKPTDKYKARGVSASKEDVHAAIRNLDMGLYPGAFCKVYPDFLAGDDNFCNLMSSDGSGTKSILAYLYWKETGDLSVWKGIAQDVVVMNLDDLVCMGATDKFLFTSLINRNKNLIPAEVLKAIIEGTAELFEHLSESGIDIKFLGGETADLGDAVRTITVDGTMTTRMKRSDLVLTKNIQPGQVIVGLASYGQCNYETVYNSGIGSNGLTSARHDLLFKQYANLFPESVDPSTSPDVVYNGPYHLTDIDDETGIEIGKLLLAPTRTFAPVIKQMINELNPSSIKGLIHCTGGGQTKVLHYIDQLHIVKDNLLDVPRVFHIIQKHSGTSDSEMYKVYNMGTRMEIYVDDNEAKRVIEIAHSFGISAQKIGYVETCNIKKVSVYKQEQVLDYF